MERVIKITMNGEDNYILKDNILYRYVLYKGNLTKMFSISKLLLNDDYFIQTCQLGYDNFSKKYMSDYDTLYIRIEKEFYIPISKNFIEFYKLNWNVKEWDNDTENWSDDIIVLTNIHLKNNVDCFYELSLLVEIEGIRTSFTRSFAFEDLIYIETTEDEELNATMTKMFGEPKNIPELESEKYGSGLRYFYFYVPKSRIDKIIGIKRFRDTTTIGEEGGEQFTGETEEIVLDMHHFDDNVYTIFKEHGMLSIEE